MEVLIALEVMLAALRALPELSGLSVEPVTGENLPFGVSVRHVGPGTDDKVQPLDTLMSTMTFYVVLALPGDAATREMATMARAIHKALNGLGGSTADGQVYLCQRTGPIAYGGRSDGASWQYLGGVYEVDARAD